MIEPFIHGQSMLSATSTSSALNEALRAVVIPTTRSVSPHVLFVMSWIVP